MNSKSFAHFFSGTMLSRISGMIRDLVMAFAFGDHPSVAAFMVAFRLSHLFRRLLGEGPFQSAFIPHFEELRIKDPLKANFFFRKLYFLLTIILLTITLFSEVIIGITCNYFNISNNNREILNLTGWLLPGLIFICLYGLNISLLNCHESFFIPSFAPFICNAIWIFGALLLQNEYPTSAMPLLAKLIVIGFFCQWLFTLPLTLKKSKETLKEKLSLKIPSEIKNLLKSFSLGAIGVGAIQINAFLDTLFARYADLRGPVYLWYSIRLEQLAMAVLGIACVSTIVPRLSRAIKSQSPDASICFSFGFNRTLALMIPATFAILILGFPSVNLLYGRGEFTNLAVIKTTCCLWAYSLALLPSTLVILFSALFYAKNDFKRPTIASCTSIAFNVLLNAIFVFIFNLGAISIALATGLSAWINFIILKRLVTMEYQPTKAGPILLISTLATGVTFILNHFLIPYGLSRTFIYQLLNFIVLFISFIGSLLLFAKVFKNKEILNIIKEFYTHRDSKFG